MYLLETTLPTPEENLALDEAILDWAGGADSKREVLRLWESPRPFVVVGRASRVQEEVRVAACQAAEIPVLRRCSGGTAVVAGPGCLMYAVILDCRSRPELRRVNEAHDLVLNRICAGLARLVPEVRRQGTSDLAIGAHKFSGNSLRCRRDAILYHGTILYEFPLTTIAQWLGDPPRQPDYRRGRSHQDFLRNLALPGTSLRQAIIEAWQPSRPLVDWPAAATARLVETRYSLREWNFRW